jgi:hypothetical protein
MTANYLVNKTPAFTLERLLALSQEFDTASHDELVESN